MPVVVVRVWQRRESRGGGRPWLVTFSFISLRLGLLSVR